jgi:hypothetical protein
MFALCELVGVANTGTPAMTAYLFKTRNGFQLTIVNRPCCGEEFQAGEHIAVAGKREARAICKARGAKPWNF